jgi:hypothetical protein
LPHNIEGGIPDRHATFDVTDHYVTRSRSYVTATVTRLALLGAINQDSRKE